VPTQQQPCISGREATEDLGRFPAQDVRVVEGATKREEREVEGNRHANQQGRRSDLNAHAHPLAAESPTS
jgi:hypothetical protein